MRMDAGAADLIAEGGRAAAAQPPPLGPIPAGSAPHSPRPHPRPGPPGARLQLGISRGSPEQVIDGWRYFGQRPIEGEDDRIWTAARRRFLDCWRGKGFARPNRVDVSQSSGVLRLEPYSEGLRDRIWWGSASNATAAWAAKLGMNLQTSTSIRRTGEPAPHQQALRFATSAAWKECVTAHSAVSVSRSIFALLDDRDRPISDEALGRGHNRLSLTKYAGDIRPQLCC